jgi:DNA-binding FadR family transcriptional regulator
MFSPRLQRATAIPIAKTRTAALALADRFEADIVEQEPVPESRWVFGPEQSLASRYNASSNVVRQALRILEARRIGSMRRGAGGGLALRIPEMTETVQLVALYLEAIDADPGDAMRAAAMLQQTVNHRENGVVLWVQHFVSELQTVTLTPSPTQVDEPANRALLIARRIIDAARKCEWSDDGVRLGTLDELIEQHASGRPVLLQALRILEDLEMVRVQRGRGGGFLLRKPTPGAIVRAVFPHLRLRRFPLRWSEDLIWSINTINAVAVAQRPGGQALRALDQAIRAVRPEQFQQGDFSLQVRIWRTLADLQGNQVLHVLIRSLFYFQIHSGLAVWPEMPVAQSQRLHALTQVLVDAINSANPAAVNAIMAEYEALSRHPGGVPI